MDNLRLVLIDAIGQDLDEFRDLGSLIRTAFRLVLAGILGGLLGLERTFRARPAGLRTYMLVSVGSASSVIVSEQVGIAGGDLSRIVQGLLTGVGFLGAGIIFRSDQPFHAQGLTTAAGIWLTASLGMAVGFGHPATALLMTLLSLLILAPLGRLEFRLKRSRTHPATAQKHDR